MCFSRAQVAEGCCGALLALLLGNGGGGSAAEQEQQREHHAAVAQASRPLLEAAPTLCLLGDLLGRHASSPALTLAVTQLLRHTLEHASDLGACVRFMRGEALAERLTEACTAHAAAVDSGSSGGGGGPEFEALLVQVAVLVRALGQRLPSALARRLPVQSVSEETAAADRLIAAARLLI